MKLRPKEAKGKVAVLLVLIAGILVLWQVEERNQEMGIEVAVQSSYPAVTSTPKAEKEESTPGAQSTEEETNDMIPSIETYLKINKDVIGYISIPETNINYPVLCGEDNDYYLNHDIYGNEDKPGCIMADYKYKDTNIEEEFQRHTLIYGHYLKVKTMFTSLAKYKDKEYYKSHPYIYYSNLHETGKWQVFSVYVVDADKETITRIFDNDDEYIEYLNSIKKRSMFQSEVSLDVNSKVLTLCTCSYETSNSRLIVHAVLVDE